MNNKDGIEYIEKTNVRTWGKYAEEEELCETQL